MAISALHFYTMIFFILILHPYRRYVHCKLEAIEWASSSWNMLKVVSVLTCLIPASATLLDPWFLNRSFDWRTEIHANIPNSPRYLNKFFYIIPINYIFNIINKWIYLTRIFTLLFGSKEYFCLNSNDIVWNELSVNQLDVCISIY